MRDGNIDCLERPRYSDTGLLPDIRTPVCFAGNTLKFKLQGSTIEQKVKMQQQTV